ncbi:transcriptional regulator [Stenotrophomonas chelatiphaga]|uniref:transcriptional regulator n=1 Tax=Stenotrophomonas chelatiphaga TaxID=517011 RepID=UPI0028A194FF|nr:YdaS family helix-turn-helix protein [Stenotrophomonas chelatiphaga]
MNAISAAIEKLGAGQAGIARLLGVTPQAVNQWVSGNRPVPPRHVLSIEAATGVSRHVLRPDVFGCPPAANGDAESAPQATPVAQIRQLVDSRMNKRALRQKFGFKTDAHLAKVLGLPLEQVEGWGETDIIPALPQVVKLLGHEEQPAQQRRPQDPDADRIVTLEVA